MTSFTVHGDASPEALQEIRELLNSHGETCAGFIEEKYSVMLFQDRPGSVEVYQLPELEV